MTIHRQLFAIFITGIFASFVAGCVEGALLDFTDSTSIYISNNTSESLYLSSSLQNDASDVALFQAEIPPFTTKNAVAIQRSLGLERDQGQKFEFVLESASGEQIVLTQLVTQGLISESMEFGFEDIEQSISQDSTSVYNYTTSFLQGDNQRSQIAFEAKSKARFKDVYYAITEGAQMPVVPSASDELSVVTYNIWGLPLIASDISTRFSLIPDYIRSYDVIFLQEAFDSRRSSLLAALSDTHPYQSNVLDGDGGNLYNGGVLILSRHPIVAETQYIYPDCSGSDCFADKGVLYTEVVKGGNSYHLLATHTASFNSASDRANRRLQFQQMRQLVIDQNVPSDEVVIYGGDLNVDKSTFPGDYADMLNYLQVYEPNYSGYTKSTFDPDINVHARDLASGSDYPEYLDYILQSHEYGVQLDNTNDVFIPRNSHEDLWQKWDLSDHFPVRSHLK